MRLRRKGAAEPPFICGADGKAELFRTPSGKAVKTKRPDHTERQSRQNKKT